MVDITDNYKLVNVFVDSTEKTVRVNTSDAWNVVEFEFEGAKTTINEGDEIEFIIDTGEKISGTLLKIAGKKEKTKFQIKPFMSECEQIWSITSIKEGTLKLLNSSSEDGEDE